jgi:hypothetical protein
MCYRPALEHLINANRLVVANNMHTSGAGTSTRFRYPWQIEFPY